MPVIVRTKDNITLFNAYCLSMYLLSLQLKWQLYLFGNHAYLFQKGKDGS